MAASEDELRCLIPGSAELAPTGEGPLAGATFVAKDIFAVRGRRTSFGHPRWRETHAPALETAPVLARLLGAGARLRGLAKLDQLAYSVVGNVGEGEQPLNPLFAAHYCGGSSSGTASAVAGGLADFGVGTDTAGSVRVPAAACGLYGIRPTHGAIDSEGVLPLAPSFDVVGFLARDPAVLGAVFAAAAPTAVAATRPPPRRLFLPGDVLAALGEPTAGTLRETAARLAAATGAEVRELEFGRFFTAPAIELFVRLQSREIWAAHGVWVSENEAHLAPDVLERLHRARSLAAAGAAEVAADRRARDDYAARLREQLADGALLLPILPDGPPARASTPAELAEFRRTAIRWAAPASLAGLPEAAFPVGLPGDGSLRGVGLLGGPGSDGALLATLTAGSRR